MNVLPEKLKVRADRKSAKRQEKKQEIADSAIEALIELGYANTSLRDIAAHSNLSLGMLHYYFEDRSELIIYCVGIYKEQFIGQFIAALEKVKGREAVIDAFAGVLVGSIMEEAMSHRLWYDIRTQAMFDATFEPVVAQIEKKLIAVVQTAFEKAGHNVNDSEAEVYYALIDGAFRYFTQRQIGDSSLTRGELDDIFCKLLGQFL